MLKTAVELKKQHLAALDKEDKSWVPMFSAIFVALVIDGMDLQLLSLCLPALQSEYALNHIQQGALGSYTFLGMAFGGAISGLLADKIGRVKVTKIALVIFTVFTALLGFTQSYWQFALVRFIAGLGMAAVFSVGTLLVAEYVPTEKRGVILGTLQAGWSVGYICAAFLAAAILPEYGWRPLCFLSVIPAIFSFLVLQKTKEPDCFKALKDKKTPTEKNKYLAIWKNKTVRFTFLLWALTNAALQFGYSGANIWLPSYLRTELGLDLKSMSLYIAGTYIAMVAGKVLSGILADTFGRKRVWVFGGLSTACAIPLMINFINTDNAIYLMVLFGFLYAIPYAVIVAYMSESFPAEVRGTSVATTYALGRFGSITAPLFVGFMATQYSIGYGIFALGIAYGICALIPGLFIKENAYDPQKS